MKPRAGGRKHDATATVTEECGTYGRAQWHSKNGEELDLACALARSRYMAEYRHNQEWQRRADAFVALGVAQ